MKDIVYVKLVTCTKFNNKNTATVNTTLTLKKSSSAGLLTSLLMTQMIYSTERWQLN